MSTNQGALTAFLTLQMFGLCGSLIILATAVLAHDRIPRQAIWFSFIISMALSTASYCLLLFSGHKDTPRPPFGLCLSHAALIYAAPLLTAGTIVALVTQVFLSVKQWAPPTQRPELNRYLRLFLLVFPYGIHLAMFSSCMIVGLNHPEVVHKEPGGFYCNFVEPRIPSKITGAISLALLVVTVGLQVATLYHIKRTQGVHMQSSVGRVFLFVIALLVVGIVGGVMFNFVQSRYLERNLLIATVPAVVVLIFGTQQDMLDVWLFRRPGWKSSRLPVRLDSHPNAARHEPKTFLERQSF